MIVNNEVKRNGQMFFAIHEAARLGDEDLLIGLLNSGVNVNSQQSEGLTALMVAASFGEKKSTIELLLKRGADINLHDKLRRTALMHAISCNRKAEAKILIKSGADINLQDKYGLSALMKASFLGNVEIVTMLLKRKAITTFRAKISGNTAVLIALANKCSLRSYTIVQLLLDHGADPNVRNKEGTTGLYYSTLMGNAACLSLFLEKGKKNLVNVLRSDEIENESALHQAATTDNLVTAALLVRHGADINLRTRNHVGNTPLMCAAYKGNIAMLKFLLDLGADMNKGDNSGCTAIMHAASVCQVAEVTYLLGRGASIESANGKSALMFAISATISDLDPESESETDADRSSRMCWGEQEEDEMEEEEEEKVGIRKGTERVRNGKSNGGRDIAAEGDSNADNGRGKRKEEEWKRLMYDSRRSDLTSPSEIPTPSSSDFKTATVLSSIKSSSSSSSSSSTHVSSSSAVTTSSSSKINLKQNDKEERERDEELETRKQLELDNAEMERKKEQKNLHVVLVSEKSKFRTVQLLVQHGADLGLPCMPGDQTPLVYCVEHALLDFVALLVQGGADFRPTKKRTDEKIKQYLLAIFDKDKKNPPSSSSRPSHHTNNRVGENKNRTDSTLHPTDCRDQHLISALSSLSVTNSKSSAPPHTAAHTAKSKNPALCIDPESSHTPRIHHVQNTPHKNPHKSGEDLSDNKSVCVNCQHPTSSPKKCGACAAAVQMVNVFYCSAECQKLHWPLHKFTCLRKKTARKI